MKTGGVHHWVFWVAAALLSCCSISLAGVASLAGTALAYYYVDFTPVTENFPSIEYVLDTKLPIQTLEDIREAAKSSYMSVFPESSFDPTILVSFNKKEVKYAVKALSSEDYK